ncbi:MAG: hypothetical protein Q9224_000876 [Gallowayella concinna]
MRFGKTLQSSTHEPWESKYIDYSKLKQLLREDANAKGRGSADSNDHYWTEEDEGAFVDELVNVQLEKVNAFHDEIYKSLRDRLTDCETKVQKIAASEKNEASDDHLPKATADSDDAQQTLPELLEKLDNITMEINELERYSRINYTGFLKAAKKHDRRRGSQYRVRPLLQVRLAALPFNSEDYSPLLYQLSAMYSFVRQRMEGEQKKAVAEPESKEKEASYKSHKFWVHPENLLEAKTYILRRLPVLVYNPQTSKVVESGQQDPRITSLYFDNPGFALYSAKVGKNTGASSLRLRWFGHLNDNPEIHIEKKTTEENGDSEEVRLPIKMKYIQEFISGEYKMEKSLNKVQERQGTESDAFVRLQSSVEDIQGFIKDNQLQPMLRANYTRTAFQIPGDDRVRISLDTDVAFLREDSLDQERPCRDPSDWHRTDIDDNEMDFPFSGIRRGEISRFPYALLEIKIRDGANKKTNEWVQDLMSSHLVKDAARFSKFVHGVAQLFEDHVNSFPFWLSDLETDIRRDPATAFQEEQDKKAKQAEEEQAVGSYMGTSASQAFTAAVGSPVAKHIDAKSADILDPKDHDESKDPDIGDDEDQITDEPAWKSRGIPSFLPSFSGSKYGRSRQREATRLPPGVEEPGRLIKDTGPVRVEPKVWLANQRTFIKWQHISVLLATLSLSLYNAAGENNSVARSLAVAYTLIAAMAGIWSWWIYMVRSRMIEARSGKDFDNVYGPIIVCVALIIALCLNFALRLSLRTSPHEPGHSCFHSFDSLEHEDPDRSFSSAESHWHGSIDSSDGSSCSTTPDPLIDSATSILKPPITWPPIGFTNASVLTVDEAMEIVADGAIMFDQHSRPAYHSNDAVAHAFVLLSLGDGSSILDGVSPSELLADDMTLSLGAGLAEPVPWRTLEQPSMTSCFGGFPGTITLNRYIASFNRSAPPVEEYSTPVSLGKLDLDQILERLWLLQKLSNVPFEQTEEDMYFLYSRLVSDPEQDYGNGTLEQDFEVLSGLLSSEIWVDFSKPQKQFVAKYFAVTPWDISAEVFFHQILIGAELGRRIRALAAYVDDGTERLMSDLPRQVAWSVALSSKFLQNLTIERFDDVLASSPEESFILVPHNKVVQLSKVLDFGHALKWPSVESVEGKIKAESGSEGIRGPWSVPSWTFLSGAVLPGPISSWMLMSCLIDCNPAHRLVLAGLGEMHPQSGIQYLGNTYWYWESIAGKVFGAMHGSKSVAGWIGPCMYTPDLEVVQCIRINHKQPKDRMKDRKSSSMIARSSPLGPAKARYPVSEFALVLPSYSSIVGTVRLEGLAINNPTPCNSKFLDECQAAVQFTIDGTLYSMCLRYDVFFIAAAGCWAGPHALHCSYTYKAVRLDELININQWAGIFTQADWQVAPPTADWESGEEEEEEDDNETVLVIEAYGIADNAVLARAW